MSHLHPDWTHGCITTWLSTYPVVACGWQMAHAYLLQHSSVNSTTHWTGWQLLLCMVQGHQAGAPLPQPTWPSPLNCWLARPLGAMLDVAAYVHMPALPQQSCVLALCLLCDACGCCSTTYTAHHVVPAVSRLPNRLAASPVQMMVCQCGTVWLRHNIGPQDNRHKPAATCPPSKCMRPAPKPLSGGFTSTT
jgi:hypothetical protein